LARTDAEKFAYINDYKKKHCKRLICEVRKEYYESVVAPYLNSHDISTSAFLKRCMDYVIDNDIDIFTEGK
jgi:hypothetical protein